MIFIEKKIQDSAVQLAASIEACKKTLEASALIYSFNKQSAEQMFKVFIISMFF